MTDLVRIVGDLAWDSQEKCPRKFVQSLDQWNYISRGKFLEILSTYEKLKEHFPEIQLDEPSLSKQKTKRQVVGKGPGG